MDQFSFVFTIFFLLLGPVKLIPAFAQVARGRDMPFQRALAIRAVLITAVIVAFVALAGESFVQKYHISIGGVQIAGGLVLLLAALNTIFGKPAPVAAGENASATQLAISPLATPIIVPPAGVAAILIFILLEPAYPGIKLAVGIALAIILVLDFLVMFFNAWILKAPGLMPAQQLLGAVLVFMQVALAVETILDGLRHMGVIAV